MLGREAKQTGVNTTSPDTNASNEQEFSENPSSLTFIAHSNYVAPSIIQRAKTNPGKLTPANVLALQRTIGNKAVQMMIARTKQAGNIRPFPTMGSIIQRKIGELGNVIFGLEGKTDDAIRNAVQAGYTTFDGADSYGNTIKALAAAIQDLSGTMKKKREDFEIIYKVDATPPKDLAEHIIQIAGWFGGYLDHVLIHKATDTNLAAHYDPILIQLKQKGVVKAVGAGDVTSGMKSQLETKDSFEVEAIKLLTGSDREALIKSLNQADKPVFVYNIVDALKKLLNLDKNVQPTKLQIMAIVTKIQMLVPNAEPILSSNDKDRQAANLKVLDFTGMTGNQNQQMGEIQDKLEGKASVKDDAEPFAQMPDGMKEKFFGLMFKGYDWAAEYLKYEQKELTEKECNEHKANNMQDFAAFKDKFSTKYLINIVLAARMLKRSLVPKSYSIISFTLVVTASVLAPATFYSVD